MLRVAWARKDISIVIVAASLAAVGGAAIAQQN